MKLLKRLLALFLKAIVFIATCTGFAVIGLLVYGAYQTHESSNATTKSNGEHYENRGHA
jgi:hypothetical protein